MISFLRCLCLLVSIAGTVLSAQPRLTYELSPLLARDRPSLSVALTIRTHAVDSTVLILPNDYGGQDHFSGIQGLRVTSGAAVLSRTSRRHVQVLHHPPDAILRVEYLVSEVRTGTVSIGDHYQAVIRPDVIHALGNGLLIVPDWDDSVDVEFLWSAAPATWRFASSFGLGPGPLHTRQTISWLSHSIWLAGDIRLRETVVNDHPVAVALHGRWSFDDSELLRLVRTIVQTERDFFDDHDFPFFLVTALEIGGDNDQGGTGRVNSFGLFLSNDRRVDLRLKRLLAHEIFHTWNGDRTEREQPEGFVYWFTEGFADYYARRFLLRSGLLTQEEYLHDLNAVLSEYFTSSMRTMLTADQVSGVERGRNAERMPYRRGDVLAHVLDAAGHRQGLSMDSTIRQYLLDAWTEHLPIANVSLLGRLSLLLDPADRGLLSAWISGEVMVDPWRPMFEGCAQLEVAERRRFYVIGETLFIPSYRFVEGAPADCLLAGEDLR